MARLQSLGTLLGEATDMYGLFGQRKQFMIGRPIFSLDCPLQFGSQ